MGAVGVSTYTVGYNVVARVASRMSAHVTVLDINEQLRELDAEFGGRIRTRNSTPPRPRRRR